MLENLSLEFAANNKGADKPAHMCRLISIYVIHLLESIILKLTTCEILRFKLICVAVAGWFEYHFVGNSEDRVCQVEAHLDMIKGSTFKWAAS